MDQFVRRRSSLTTEQVHEIFARLKLFNFKGNQIRVTEHGGQRWIVFSDICKALDYKNPNNASKKVRPDEKCKLDVGLKNTLAVCIGSDVKEWNETQWTEFDTEDKGARAGDPDYVDHRHKLVIKPYMPKVGDQVLAIYIPIFNADGFILGGIKPWQ